MAVRNRRLAQLALFVALAVVHTWPLASDPWHQSRLDNADTALNAWTISWVAHVLPGHPLRLFEAPIFYPEPHTLAYSEHMVVPAMMGAPLLWFDASPVFVYNVLVMLGLALSGFSLCVVVERWTGSAAAGIVSGLLFGFNAHVLTRFAHLQALHLEFLPIVLLAFDNVVVLARWRDVAVLVASFVLQALCSNYTLVFESGALVACAAARVETLRKPAVLARLAVAGAASAALMLPFLWPYYVASRDQGLIRPLDEVAKYSAGWQDYFVTGGTLHYRAWSHRIFNGRQALFPGVTALALSAVALAGGARWREPRVRMTLAFGLLGLALSFGPALPGYTWLYDHVPLLRGLRAAARWGILPLLSTAILAGFGTARLQARWGSRAWFPALAVGLAGLTTVEALRAPIGFVPFDRIPRIYDRLRQEPHVVLLEFPLYFGGGFHLNGPFLLANTRYFGGLINGYSGFQPQSYIDRASRWQQFPAPEVVDEIRRTGVNFITIHLDPIEERFGREALKALDEVPGLELVEEADRIRLYRLR